MSAWELRYGSSHCALWTHPWVEKEQGGEPKLHINYTNLLRPSRLVHIPTQPCWNNIQWFPWSFRPPPAPPLLAHNTYFCLLFVQLIMGRHYISEVLLVPSQMPSSVTFLDMETWLFSISSHCVLSFDKCQVLSRQAWPPSGQGYREHSCMLSIALGNGN